MVESLKVSEDCLGTFHQQICFRTKQRAFDHAYLQVQCQSTDRDYSTVPVVILAFYRG